MSREQLSVIDPVLIDLDKKDSGGTGPHQPMSLRVHMSSPFVSQPYSSSSHARLVDVREFDGRRALHSPPPITTLDSPSPSVADRSSTNTPHQRRSPPLAQAYYPNQQELIPSSAPRQPPAHFSSRGDPINQHQYYPFEHHRFDAHHDSQRYPHFVQHQQMHEPYGRPQYPVPASQPPPVTIVHTDDASTKLTDGIRRRCFNCCTTDTSTWRRSNLSPGKVLCNKCGLFERTHSRPRPDQFPHKRGPLATQSLRGRTPPGLAHGGPGSTSSHAHSAHNGTTQLPPIVGGYQYHHANITPLSTAPSQQGPDGYPSQQGPPPPPPGQTPLPGLQSWHNTSGSSSASAANGHAHGGQAPAAPDGPGSGGNSASTSAHGTPLLPSRRPLMEGHTTLSQSSASAAAGNPSSTGNGPAPRSSARYDDGLSSNAAMKKEEDGGASSPRGSGPASGSAKSEPSPERD